VREFATSARVSLRNFYARRALRLLPALAVLLVIATVLALTLSPHDANRPDARGLVSIVFYVGNWMTIAHPASLGLGGSTWSLAIEEQFYIVWPILLIVMLRRRLPTSVIAGFITAGIAASALWRAHYWYARLGHLDFKSPIIAYAYSGLRRHVWNRVLF